MTTNFKQSTLNNTGTVDLWCEQCGQKIDGEPFQASFSGWCCCFDPVHFCSSKCWENTENMFNTENWPEAPKAPEGW